MLFLCGRGSAVAVAEQLRLSGPAGNRLGAVGGCCHRPGPTLHQTRVVAGTGRLATVRGQAGGEASIGAATSAGDAT